MASFRPAVPFDKPTARKEAGSSEPVGEVVPAVGCDCEVEVVRVAVKAVVADGVPAHHKAREAD
jgi:hypothetical protein